MNTALMDDLFDEKDLQDWLSEHGMDMQLDAEIMTALEPYALPAPRAGRAIEQARFQLSQEQSGSQRNADESHEQMLYDSIGDVQPLQRNGGIHSTSNTQQQSSGGVTPMPASSMRSQGTTSSDSFQVPGQPQHLSQQSTSGPFPTVHGESVVLPQHHANHLQDRQLQQQWLEQQLQQQEQKVDEQLMQVYQQLQLELETEVQQQQQLSSQAYPPHHGIWAEHQAWWHAHMLQQQQQQQHQLQVWQQQHQLHLLQQQYVLNLQRHRLNAALLQQLQLQQPGVIDHLIRQQQQQQQQQQWIPGVSDNMLPPPSAAAAAPACAALHGITPEPTACSYSMQSCWNHAPKQQQQMVPPAAAAHPAAAADHDPAMLAALPVGMVVDHVSAGTSGSDGYNSSSSTAEQQLRSTQRAANTPMAAVATAAQQQQQLQQHEEPEVKVKLEEYSCVTRSLITPAGAAAAVPSGPAFGTSGVTGSPDALVTEGPSPTANTSSDLACTIGLAAAVTCGPAPGAAATAGTRSVPAAEGGNKKGSSSRASARKAPRQTCKTYKDMCPARRFRERQKCLIKSLESELAEKLAELDVLNSEHEVLTLRSDVLQAAVACRDDQLSVLQQQERCYCAKTAAAAAKPHQTVDDVISQLQGGSSSMRSGAQAAAPAGPSSSSNSDDSTCADSDAAAAAGSNSEGVANHAGYTLSGNPDGGLCLQCDVYADITPGASEELEPEFLEQIQKWGLQDILNCWKAFTREISEELLKIEREESAAALAAATPAAAVVKQEPDSGSSSIIKQEALKRIEFLMQGHVVRCKAVSALNTDAYCYMFERNLDTGLPSHSTDAHWRGVVGKLNLTEHQVKCILAHSELHFSSLNRVLDERAALLQKLEQQQQQQQVSATPATAATAAKAVSAGTQQRQQNAGSSSSSSNGVLDWSQMPFSLEVVQPLLMNLKREHLLKVALKCFLWSKILTPRQAAAVAVYSHPFFPDMHAIMCVMCEDAQASDGYGSRTLVFPHRVQQGSRCSILAAAAAAAAAQ